MQHGMFVCKKERCFGFSEAADFELFLQTGDWLGREARKQRITQKKVEASAAMEFVTALETLPGRPDPRWKTAEASAE